MDFSTLTDTELIKVYGQWIKELKIRGIIRTKNIVGEIGEYLAIKYYTETRGLPKLQAAPISTTNMDAISDKGERYSIKTTTSNTTGVFYGLNTKNDLDKIPDKIFEKVIVVILDDEYNLNKIIQLDWDTFLKHKHWHSRMNAWNLHITKKLLNDSKIIFDKNKSI